MGRINSYSVLVIPITVLLLFVTLSLLLSSHPYVGAQPNNQYMKEPSVQGTSNLIEKLNDKGIDLIYNQDNYTEAIRYFGQNSENRS